MKKLDTNNLPIDTDHHAYLNTEKINEIVEWINGLSKVTKKEIVGG